MGKSNTNQQYSVADRLNYHTARLNSGKDAKSGMSLSATQLADSKRKIKKLSSELVGAVPVASKPASKANTIVLEVNLAPTENGKRFATAKIKQQ